MPKYLTHPLKLLVLLAVFAVTTALIAGFFGRWHPFFDSFAHFRAHLGFLLALSAIPLIFAASRRHAAVALLLGLGAAGTTFPPGSMPGFGAVQAAAPVGPNQPTYKLLQLNLFHSNKTPERVLSLIGRVRPDVVTLEEVSPLWEPKLDLLKAAYPYQINCRSSFTGTAILSRRPFAKGADGRCFEYGSLTLAPVDFAGVTIDVAALHLHWPWPFEQHKQVDRLAGALGEIGQTAILGGDFNATPWSFTGRQVMALSGMEAATEGQSSWLPFELPRSLRVLGLPIDHVLTKGDITAQKVTLLEPVGSDHWPVLVEFTIAPNARAPEASVTVQAASKRDAG